MGLCDGIKDVMSKAVFTSSTLLSCRGGLHMAQIILSVVTFLLAAFRGGGSHSYWVYAMFTWSFCPIMTLIITIIEMFTLNNILDGLCMDWFDFTTGMAMSSTLMTVSVAITYANFYTCMKCFYGWIVSIFAFLCGLVYILEVVKDKILDRKGGSYLAALPGFWKVMEAFVSCMIFVSLTGYRDSPPLILCVLAYAIPFPILPLIIASNILKKVRNCLPFNLARCEFIFLAISVGLYIFAAIVWPIFMFKNNPRPSNCPPSYCIWAIEFMVALFTYVNLVLFTLDLIFSLLGFCGFKRA
ncbi:myeloid-associated differentiation marker-like protein 2 [Cottoperca gobio]|uniref:Myeloid-associated differentiation marker-like protein 2 n=1 Tax=Cottoperca gobio TaxID=56716 RepID=A0A6J2RQS4_COTGO|nr:myeloid-associated differentiation marker-like protein 2 [Cottoperca gobio]